MKRLAFIILILMLFAAMLTAGCSSAPAPSSNPNGEISYSQDDEAPVPAPATGAPAASAAPSMAADNSGSGVSTSITGNTVAANDSVLQPGVNRKVVYTGDLEAKTKTFDDDYNRIMDTLIADGGYVGSSKIDGTKPMEYGDSGRNAYMTLRVPSGDFDSFIKMLQGIGDNMSTSISGQDVSLQYYDTEQQLETLRTRQSRLQDMLKDPDYKLKDLIDVENELADVSTQIESLETNLRDFDSLIEYSTVNITLHEINTIELKSVPTPEEGLGTQISNGFYGVLNVLAAIGRGLLIFFTAGSPALILIAIIVVLIVIFRKRSHKNRRAASNPQYMQYPPQKDVQNKQNNNGGENNDNNKI